MAWRIVVLLLLAVAAAEAAACVAALLAIPGALRDEGFWFCIGLWSANGFGSVLALALEALTPVRSRLKPEELRTWALAVSSALVEGQPMPRRTFWQGVASTLRSTWFQLGYVALLNALVFHSAAGSLSPRFLLGGGE